MRQVACVYAFSRETGHGKGCRERGAVIIKRIPTCACAPPTELLNDTAVHV